MDFANSLGMSTTVWHRSGIPTEDWEYRRLVRLWLPVYYAIAMYIGVVGMVFGSPLLNRLFTPFLTDLFTGAFTLVSAAALIGLAFPRLWKMEVVGTVLLAGLVAAYIATISVYGNKGPEDLPNLFVLGTLALGLPFAFFRLDLIGQSIAARKLIDKAVTDKLFTVRES